MLSCHSYVAIIDSCIVTSSEFVKATWVNCLQADPQKLQPEWEEMAATSCAVQNMWLLGTALGVAGVLPASEM